MHGDRFTGTEIDRIEDRWKVQAVQTDVTLSQDVQALFKPADSHIRQDAPQFLHFGTMDLLYGTCAYTSEVTSVRLPPMSDDVERKIEQPKTEDKAPEGVKQAGQFVDTNKQMTWVAATEGSRTSDKDSVTMPAITEEMNEILKTHGGKWNKCEIDYSSDFAVQPSGMKIAIGDDYLNRSEYSSQPETIPIDKHVFVEDLLQMASPIGPASQQSEAIKNLLTEMRKHPWKVQVVFEPHPRNPEYDPNENQGVIYVDSTFSKQKQVETFAHELYHATHQNLDDLYGSRDPVSLERYKQIRIDQETGAFLTEFKVNRELRHTEKPAYKYVDGNDIKTKFIEDLVIYSRSGAIDEVQSKEQIAKFLTQHPAAVFGTDGKPVKDSSGRYTTESYPEKHENDYSNQYKPNFNQNRKSLLQRNWLGKGY